MAHIEIQNHLHQTIRVVAHVGVLTPFGDFHEIEPNTSVALEVAPDGEIGYTILAQQLKPDATRPTVRLRWFTDQQGMHHRISTLHAHIRASVRQHAEPAVYVLQSNAALVRLLTLAAICGILLLVGIATHIRTTASPPSTTTPIIGGVMTQTTMPSFTPALNTPTTEATATTQPVSQPTNTPLITVAPSTPAAYPTPPPYTPTPRPPPPPTPTMPPPPGDLVASPLSFSSYVDCYRNAYPLVTLQNIGGRDVNWAIYLNPNPPGTSLSAIPATTGVLAPNQSIAVAPSGRFTGQYVQMVVGWDGSGIHREQDISIRYDCSFPK